MITFLRFFLEEKFFPQKHLEDENNRILTNHAFWSAFKHQLSVLNQSIIAIESIHDIADRSATDPSNLKVNEGYITSYDGEQELREDAFLMSALGKLLPLFRMHLIKTSGNYVDIISQINELEENIQTNIETE